MERIHHCRRCRSLSDTEVCVLCSNSRRDKTTLCIVETPSDVVALEQAISYGGLYFVLGGHLSPLDGVGPKELGLDGLDRRLAEGDVRELILATNPTVEGEATAHYIAEMAKARQIRVTRIAHGVPLGSELEYMDGGTLSHAFAWRTELE